LRLLIKTIDNDGRLRFVEQYLNTPWEIEVVDTADCEAFEHALTRADAMVSMSWDWEIAAASHLRLLQLPGAGTDAIDFTKLPAEVTVCNCYEHEIGIAEYVLSAMLEWNIGIRAMDRRLRAQNWTGSYLCGPVHGELYGKTLGIVGFGRIGREVARRAQAFGMRVVACTRTPAPDALADRVDSMVRLHEMLKESDFVVLTLPLTPETRSIFDETAFNAMRHHALLINVARGPLIDEKALYTALKERRIAGAAIDVWYSYPQQGSRAGPRPCSEPLESLDNLIMTPHASGWTEGLLPRRNRAIATNLNRLSRGEPLINVVRGGTGIAAAPISGDLRAQ
jgi:phosphoglycerate dehydrogenase-like enzyme